MTSKAPTLHKARHSILLALALLLPGGLFAGSDAKSGKDAKALTIADSWSLPGILGGGVKTTDDYTEGNGFLVLPVISTLGRDGMLGGDVLFIEPYSSWGERGEVAASLGIGWRHLFSDQSVSAITKPDGHQAGFLEEGVYIGANLFVDMLDTQFDNQFWQLGVGIEAGTRYLEVRGNYYIPLSDKQLAFEQRSKETFTSSRTTTTTQQGAPTSAPFATGNTIAQDTSLTTFATTTTTNTTIESLFRLYEEGMEGWDAEVALLVPGLDRYMDVKLIGGYFSFDNQPFGPQTGGTGNVEGWKAGIEVRPVPAVVLTATWYEDERFVGSDWLYGLQLQVPFEMGDLGDGKGFWSRIADAFTPRRRHLAERLVEPVHRQNEAIKVGNETETKQTVSTSVKRVTRVVSQTSQRIVLVDDVVFVNSGAPTGNGIQTGDDVTGTGTAEQPKATIQAGATVAQTNSNATTRVWNVYTQGTGAAYTENVTANVGSVNFIGSGKLIAGLNGTTFGTGPMPQVTGNFAATSIPYLGITAYEIVGGASTGISATNVTNLVLQENNIHNTGTNGIDIFTTASNTDSASISQNTILDTTGNGIFLSSAGGTTLNATLNSNQITNAGVNGILAAAGSSTLNMTATGNVINNSTSDGIAIGEGPGGVVTATLSSNQISGSGASGINLTNGTTSIGNFTVAGNTIASSSLRGISISVAGTTATNTSVLSGNTITNSTGAGVFMENLGTGTTLGATISDNTIDGTTAGQGIVVNTQNIGTTSTLAITGNQISNINGTGIQLQNSIGGGTGSSTLHVTALDNNTITNVIGINSFGILSQTGSQPANPSTTLFDSISGNTLTTLGSHGFNFLSQGIVGTSVTITSMDGNSISGAAGNGIFMDAAGLGSLTASITNNSVTSSGSSGIKLQSGVTSPTAAVLTATVDGNTINGTGNTQSGISATAGSTNATLTLNSVSSNSISNTAATAAGIDIAAIDGNVTANQVNSNQITGVAGGGDGLRFRSTGAGVLNFNAGTVNNNIITDVRGNGILFSVPFGVNAPSLLNGTVSGNQITLAGPSAVGIFVQSDNGGHISSLTIASNTIDGSGAKGIFLSNAFNGASGINAVLVNNNTISGMTGFGIQTLQGPGSGFPSQALSASITNNLITMPSSFAGISVQYTGFSNLTSVQNLVISGNTISGAASNGIQLFSPGINPGSLNVLQFDNNTVNAGYTQDGLRIIGTANPAFTNINGTINNSIGTAPGGFNRVNVQSGAGTVNGTIIINTNSVDLNTTPLVP